MLRGKRSRPPGRLADTLAKVGPFSVLLVPVAEWIPWLESNNFRWPVVLIVVAVSIIGFCAGGRIARWRERDRLGAKAELLAARKRLAEVEPNAPMRQVTESLFNNGAWRLTIYSKVRDQHGSLMLERVFAVSSDVDMKLGAPATIILKRSLFNEVFETNLANVLYRGPRGSGPFVDASEEFDPTAWKVWQSDIFGGTDALIGGDDHLLTRQYVWYATQDPESERVLLALAESTDQSGVKIDYLTAPATSAWIVMASNMAGVNDAVAEVLGRDR